MTKSFKNHGLLVGLLILSLMLFGWIVGFKFGKHEGVLIALDGVKDQQVLILLSDKSDNLPDEPVEPLENIKVNPLKPSNYADEENLSAISKKLDQVASDKSWYVQVTSTLDKDSAMKFGKILGSKDFKAFLIQEKLEDSSVSFFSKAKNVMIYRVLVGKYNSKEEAILKSKEVKKRLAIKSDLTVRNF